MYPLTFGVIDYIILALTISVSAIVGFYFGCFGSKQKSASEYLYGDRHMKAIPVGLSICSSSISAVIVTGIPIEIYSFGTQYFLVAGGTILSLILTWSFVLPVFCGNLNIKTPYEYYELRFNFTIRIISSLIYVVHSLLYLPMVLYATTSAFSVASGIPIIYCTTVVGGVCAFYTMLGGFKSVVWTDTIQATLIIGSCLFLTCFGMYKLGGFFEVWRLAGTGQRIQFFNMDPNPLIRTTFWTCTLGQMMHLGAHFGCSAGSIQRYMSLSNERQGRISTFIGVLAYVSLIVICGLFGLCMYVYFRSCDPVENKEIPNTNMILSYFVTNLVGHIPGFNGFFVAGLVSAGLSTLSAELNTVAGIIYHDFIQKIFKNKKIGESKGAFIMKIIVLVNGLFHVIIAPLLTKASYLLQLATMLMGVSYGAKLGLIILGTTIPTVNAEGALCGIIVSLIVLSWISIGGSYYNVASEFVLPVSTDNCSQANNTELYNATTEAAVELGGAEGPLFIYKLSYMYYAFLGTAITIIIGVAASYIIGKNDVKKIDPRLLIPCLRQNENNAEMIKYDINDGDAFEE